MPLERDGNGGAASPLFHPTDTILAAIILIVSAWVYYVTTTFEEVPQLLAQNVGPAVFPQLVVIAIVLMALALPFEHLFIAGGRARLDSDRSKPVRRPTWLTGALLAAIVALMPWLGTLLTMFLACLLMPPLWGERRLKVVLPFAVLVPLGVNLVFSGLLKVHFEPGLLAWIFE